MAAYPNWVLNQQNQVTFVLVDSTGTEVAGLGTGFTLEVSKAGGVFAGSAGTKAEISDGWYSYLTTAGEADTIGPVSIRVIHASIIQQNLEYVVQQRTSNVIAFTYTVTVTGLGTPIEGANVWITTDIAGLNTVWTGITDSFGVARSGGLLPFLDAGTYYFWTQKTGYSFTNPDTEVVS